MSEIVYDPNKADDQFQAGPKPAIPKFVSYFLVSTVIVAGVMLAIFLMYKLITGRPFKDIFKQTNTDSDRYSGEEMQHFDREITKMDPLEPSRPEYPQSTYQNQ
ncbi:hypothetical protein OGAPHI_004379 [Ogataea philodendri]|uniref:Uncharacterized protein n=1 Tax=Ogataea philodendri TaxID=1378263 RepID=A0A9P8P706_9ASCO|nr:uncharacterized protein OGAPHI_004379 [Ogataea philodendri]KAH3666190.1 hypothetical protein OGAPHI_004379 [Ogataea philodendri]